MNKDKWSAPAMPVFRLVLKLGEEAGEVAKSFNKAVDGRYNKDRHVHHMQQAMKECDHVIFIAEQTKEAILADIAIADIGSRSGA